MLTRTFTFLLFVVACSTRYSPTTRSVYYRPASETHPGVASPAAPATVPPQVAQGVVRIDGSSTSCDAVVAVHADGGAAVLCTFEREGGCGIRQLGPDGEERSRSDLAPGTCSQWVTRPDGGGFLVTRATDNRSVTVMALDANGKHTAVSALTSKEDVWPYDARLAADGGLFVAVRFHKDLMFGNKRLGTTKHSVSGIVKFLPSLDRLAWSRLFETRRTEIAALLPATRDGVDALVSTRGPLVPGAPVNPPVDPATGAMFGGDTYGWQTERVSLDSRGKPVARVDMMIERNRSVMDAVQVDDAIAMLTPNLDHPNRTDLTLARADGQRERIALASVMGSRFEGINDRASVIDCDCSYAQGKQTGTWTAREVGGSRMQIGLAGALGSQSPSWSSVAVLGDRVAAIGTTADPATGTPITFTALAQLPSGSPAIDLRRLSLVDHLALAPACRGARPQISAVVASDRRATFDTALEACGIAPLARIALTTYRDGGLRSFSIQGATTDMIACARRVFEPAFACPTVGNNISFAVRLPADARTKH
ncbi:MAG: hypothetical protein JWO36_1770 [Myxococcales bacterium]|nr:hypothetical protein [Myxococcales bacterium]